MRKSRIDELAQRRAAREREAAGHDDDTPQFTWTDALALIIATYQVLLPILLVMLGVMLGIYFLFQIVFR
ncbi:MAG: hypothetical protein LOD90_02665 [Symbiobacteriaceae bacterium]|nr:MAG: hypothetical protein DIU55_05910 [Bacillota bacterium]